MSTGWVALALSHTKSIKGADLFIGWVNPNGHAVLKDFHSVDGRSVREDSSQDVELLYGEEVEGTTILRFKRKLETCDMDQDIRVTNDTFRVIGAYSNNDPGEEDVVDWRDLDRAGGRLLHLYQGEDQEVKETSMKKWVVTSNQMIIPQKVGKFIKE